MNVILRANLKIDIPASEGAFFVARPEKIRFRTIFAGSRLVDRLHGCGDDCRAEHQGVTMLARIEGRPEVSGRGSDLSWGAGSP